MLLLKRNFCKFFRLIIILILISFLITKSSYRFELYTPTKTGKILHRLIDESSGLVKSQTRDSLLWTHNDSGDKARIFAISPDGTIITPEDTGKFYAGILLPTAVNIDFEDIAADNRGNLIIGDIGNNNSDRRNLALYIVNEPDPRKDTQTQTVTRYRFSYPDQKVVSRWHGSKNFDAEALFFANDRPYILTKHHDDKWTTLYAFDSLTENHDNIPRLAGKFFIDGMVTAADATVDGSVLAVLTYDNVWLFKKPANSDNYFDGLSSKLDLSFWDVGQCESCCFFGNSIIIGNEQRTLFSIPIDDFPEFTNKSRQNAQLSPKSS